MSEVQLTEEQKQFVKRQELIAKFKEANKEKIELLKKQHTAVYIYMTEDGKYCILKAPDLMILDACKTLSGGSSIKFDIALVENTWLDGDIEFKTVDKYRIGLHDWLGGLIKRVDGQLEEL